MLNIKKHYLEGKLSHIILIETNNQDFCLGEIKDFAKELCCLEDCKNKGDKCSLCLSIEKEESLNFFVVKPEGKMIKKEQIKYIQDKCALKPVVSKNNVYVICNVEKLMPKAANTMLKFIEEPYDNTYGFLITNNKEGVINTIKSRCEIYCINYQEKNEIDLEVLSKAKKYIESVETMKNDILINKDFFTKEEKNYIYIESFFKYVLEIYRSHLKNDFESTYYCYSLMQNLNKTNFLKRIKTVNSILDNIKYNLNIDLILDRFIIEVGEENE